jgi:hypothetical protein
MNRWGCFGLILGSLIGLLLAILFFVWARQVALPTFVQPVTLADPEVTLFLSERSLSRFASDALKSPTLVDLEPGGQMGITTRIRLWRLYPVVRLGLSLRMRGTEVVSQLHWARLGFLKIPASWLPRRIIEIGAMPGEMVTQQVPSEFEVAGLDTTPEGIEFQLKWVGSP